MTEELKQCIVCKTDKNINDFNIMKRDKKTYYYKECKTCTNLKRKIYYSKNKEILNKTAKEYYHKHKKPNVKPRGRPRKDGMTVERDII